MKRSSRRLILVSETVRTIRQLDLSDLRQASGGSSAVEFCGTTTTSHPPRAQNDN
jgi:hypothetical protein